jgi:hypothetical protein
MTYCTTVSMHRIFFGVAMVISFDRYRTASHIVF